MLLQLLAQGVQTTHCTTVDVATHVLQSNHGRGIKDTRQEDKFHEGYLNKLDMGCNKVIEGHDMPSFSKRFIMIESTMKLVGQHQQTCLV